MVSRQGLGLPVMGWSTNSVPHEPFSTPIPHPASDYIIKEKTVLLQKKDSEGFGFVLRGAKGECWPGRGREIL